MFSRRRIGENVVTLAAAGQRIGIDHIVAQVEAKAAEIDAQSDAQPDGEQAPTQAAE